MPAVLPATEWEFVATLFDSERSRQHVRVARNFALGGLQTRFDQRVHETGEPALVSFDRCGGGRRQCGAGCPISDGNHFRSPVEMQSHPFLYCVATCAFIAFGTTRAIA